MAAYLLDTNLISCILKKQTDSQRVKSKLQSLLKQNALILISPIVFYELARLLYQKQAKEKLAFLEKFVACFKWIDLKRTTWTLAAQFWANCRKEGTPTGEGLDADVLIAAQAKEHNAVVVTNNIRHFQYLGVNYESW